ncbi:MAG: molybdopterin-synthase adenylyltransferase MoeB [Pelolinea sp.]|nr:molybdopterin-synthase adenylyltransferase MoeB [Pelolinea sp.]
MDYEIKPEEILRYSRQLIIPEIGLQGQIKLKRSSLLIVGCGGLGSPIALYLASAGIGRIGLVDYDVVELSNLQRQPIYRNMDIGKSKVDIARERLLSINPEIQVDAYNQLFTSQNAEIIAEPYDIIIDGTDNIPTRYLINDLCVFSDKPYVYGAVYRFFGQLSVFHSSKGPCYRCLMPIPPSPESVPSCAVTGVVGFVPGIIGLLQTNEVIKIILGIGSSLIGKLLLVDALENTFKAIELNKDPNCHVCGSHPQVTKLIDYEQFCQTSIRDRDLVFEEKYMVTPAELKARIAQQQSVQIIDLRDPVELQIIKIPEAENVPFHQLTNTMKKWDKEQQIILICHVGFLSSIAQRIMTEAGFKDVKSLKGGLQGWGRDLDPSSIIY